MYDVIALLNAFVSSSSAPYGKEHSVRWRNGTTDHERFLLSIHKRDLASSTIQARQKLEHFLQRLSCPAIQSRLWDFWNDTCVVHFGCEQASTERPYVKVYFELTERGRLDAERGQLIHIAAKWNPLDPEDSALSRYTLVPCQNSNILLDQLGRLCPEHFVPAFEKLINRALGRCDIQELMLLAITDDNSPRKSCDLNLYSSQITIGESQDELLELAALNNCEEGDWLSTMQNLPLGHLAAGRDRVRNDFVTLYYGIEAH